LHRPQLGTSDAVRGPFTQHCERSEAISSAQPFGDCFVACGSSQ
jgi:hypothetical protein